MKRIGPVSLNYGNRQKEHQRIMKENALIAKRLSQQVSSLSQRGAVDDYSKHKALKKRMSRFPLPNRPPPILGVQNAPSRNQSTMSRVSNLNKTDNVKLNEASRVSLDRSSSVQAMPKPILKTSTSGMLSNK